jgi:hypothetical protein
MLKIILLTILVFIFIAKVPVIEVRLKLRKFPETGVVPDERTAAKIAEAIWFPNYGKTIQEQKPFKIELVREGTVWIVQGTRKQISPGGTAYIEIQKSDCKILKVTHGL